MVNHFGGQLVLTRFHHLSGLLKALELLHSNSERFVYPAHENQQIEDWHPLLVHIPRFA